MISLKTFSRILVLLSACSLAYIRFTWPAIEAKRFLSAPEPEEQKDENFIASKRELKKTFDRPIKIKKCLEAEEAYFRTYPDVGKRWKPRSAISHWNRYGKAEGRHYLNLNCTKSKDRVASINEKKDVSGFIVVAVFKNEAMNFREWISHYLWQGASHFYLVDNGSTDDWQSTIPPEVHARINVTRNLGRQRKIYSSLLPMLQEKHPKDWALVVDLDEFLYAKPPQTVAGYLSALPDSINQITFPWKVFGSSGYISHPKSVRCSFVQRDCKTHSYKSAVKISSVERLDIHKSVLKPAYLVEDLKLKRMLKKGTNRLQLNHYQIQSKEYYEKVKMTRGDVSQKGWDGKRNWAYFNERDVSDCVDTELCSILGCCAS